MCVSAAWTERAVNESVRKLEEDDRDKVYAASRSSDEKTPRFPEVSGICRTCKNAFITRRRYEALPTVVCQAIFENPRRVHLDISECTDYSRRGELSLNSMMDMAHIIDGNDPGGQYL